MNIEINTFISPFREFHIIFNDSLIVMKSLLRQWLLFDSCHVVAYGTRYVVTCDTQKKQIPQVLLVSSKMICLVY